MHKQLCRFVRYIIIINTKIWMYALLLKTILFKYKWLGNDITISEWQLAKFKTHGGSCSTTRSDPKLVGWPWAACSVAETQTKSITHENNPTKMQAWYYRHTMKDSKLEEKNFLFELSFTIYMVFYQNYKFYNFWPSKTTETTIRLLHWDIQNSYQHTEQSTWMSPSCTLHVPVLNLLKYCLESS